MLRILGICYAAKRGPTLVILALMVFATVAASLMAYAQGVVVDQAVNGLGAEVVAAIVIGGLFYAVTDAGFRIQMTLQYDIAEDVELALAQDVLTWSSSAATIDHLEDPEYLDKLTVVVRNSQALSYALWAYLEAITALVALTVSLILLWQIHPLLITLVLFAIPTVLLAGRAGDLHMNAVDRNSKLIRLEKHLHDLATSSEPLKELLVTGSGATVDERASATWQEMVDQEMRARGAAVILTAIGWSAYAGGIGLGLAWTITLVHEGRATVGDVAVVIALATALLQQIGNVLASRLRVAESGRISEHYLWLRDQSTRLPRSAVPVTRLDRGLTLDRVSFRYPGAERDVLHALSIDIPAGSVLGVVGVNGAGKSTLAKVLTGLYSPTSGEVMVDGQPALPGQLASAAAGAFQDFCEFEFLAREAVGVGELDRIHDLDAVRIAARKGGAVALVDELERGWETQLGLVFDGARLSKGQWQRLALARGLMKDSPVIMILDEPTAALDPQAEHSLFDEFATHARAISERNGAITILISHRFSTVTMTDQIVVLDDGEIVESGTHAELMGRPSRYRHLYESQARGYGGITGRLIVADLER